MREKEVDFIKKSRLGAEDVSSPCAIPLPEATDQNSTRSEPKNVRGVPVWIVVLLLAVG
jgi:hypothetical protein